MPQPSASPAVPRPAASPGQGERRPDAALRGVRPADGEGAHGLARFHYWPRIWSFAFVGLLAVLLVLERRLDGWLLGAAAVHFLAWPHLAYLRARRSSDPKRAELGNVVLDACWHSLWLVELHYPLWLVAIMLIGLVLNGMGTGGARLLVRMATGFVLTGAAWGAVRGFRFDAEVSTPLALLALVGGVLYAYGVGAGAYGQNRRLRRTKRAVEDRNRVFASLLRMSVLTHQVRDVEELLGRSLRHFRDLWPDLAFGLVVHETGRTAAVRWARFEGFGPSESSALLAMLPELRTSRLDGACSAAAGGGLHVLEVRGHLRQAEMLLLVGGPLDEETRTVVGLLLDQVASALENGLLALELQQMADTDPLTGVGNRARFDRELARAVEAKREHDALDASLVLVDVNGLKEVNDLHGHEAGDRLLVAVADLLARTSRASDLVARLGGDEFVVLCRGSGADQAERLLERIRRAERETTIDLPATGGAPPRIPVRLSIGLASTSDTRPEEILRTADARMYADKDAYYAERERYR